MIVAMLQGIFEALPKLTFFTSINLSHIGNQDQPMKVSDHVSFNYFATCLATAVSVPLQLYDKVVLHHAMFTVTCRK